MYGSTSQSAEEDRLATLNQTHTPETMRLLKPVLDSLPDDALILELGCGEGSLAYAVSKNLKPSQVLLAIDAEADQVDKANIKLKNCKKASSQHINFIDQYAVLKQLGPFDCIYCRWVICHIAIEKQKAVLAQLFQLLKPGGWFVMDDCDNRAVKWRFKQGAVPNEESQRLIDKIQPMFCDFYDLIVQDRHLNVKRNAQSMQELLQAAANKSYVSLMSIKN